MEKTPIRVILVDAKNREVTQHFIIPARQEFYRLLGCSMIEAVYVKGLPQHLLYVDEEGLINGQHDAGFQINGYPGVLCGSAIVLGTDNEGNDTDCRYTAATVQANVQFLDLTPEFFAQYL